MKNMIYLFAFAFLLSCSKDEKPQEEQLPVTVENLVGTWIATEQSYHNGAEFGTFQIIPEEERYLYRFKDNLIVEAVDQNNICEGIYSIAEQNDLKLNFECSDEILYLNVRSLTENQLLIGRSLGDEGMLIKFKKESN